VSHIILAAARWRHSFLAACLVCGIGCSVLPNGKKITGSKLSASLFVISGRPNLGSVRLFVPNRPAEPNRTNFPPNRTCLVTFERLEKP
jgi:hypothetical protein